MQGIGCEGACAHARTRAMCGRTCTWVCMRSAYARASFHRSHPHTGDHTFCPLSKKNWWIFLILSLNIHIFKNLVEYTYVGRMLIATVTLFLQNHFQSFNLCKVHWVIKSNGLTSWLFLPYFTLVLLYISKSALFMKYFT